MTSFLLMISSIKVARIVVFETGEILAPTICLYIIKFTQNTWINLSVNHSIDISKIKIEKKMSETTEHGHHMGKFFYDLIQPKFISAQEDIFPRSASAIRTSLV